VINDDTLFFPIGPPHSVSTTRAMPQPPADKVFLVPRLPPAAQDAVDAVIADGSFDRRGVA
jgi:hypothetical protein